MMKGLLKRSSTPEAQAWLEREKAHGDNPYFAKLDPNARHDDKEELVELLKMVHAIYHTERRPGIFVTLVKLGFDASPDFSLRPGEDSAMSLIAKLHEQGEPVYEFLFHPTLQINNALFQIPALAALNAAYQCNHFDLPELTVEYFGGKRLVYKRDSKAKIDLPFDNSIFIPPVVGVYGMLPNA